MSAIAIKQYFDHAREVALRKAAYEKKKIEEMENPTPIPEEVYNCEQEFSEFDTLLRRNWFVDDSDIIDLVWDATQEAFDKIMENVHTYPIRVQTVLTNTFNPKVNRVSRKTTLKLKALTNADMLTMETLKQTEFDTRFETEWQLYKKENGLSRPDGDVDERYTEVYETLERTKKELEEEMKKPVSKRYIPPSMRDKTVVLSPEAEKLQKKVTLLENEILRVKKDIVTTEYIWENEKRLQHHNEIFNKMFQV